jgi:hypothetical protein
MDKIDTQTSETIQNIEIIQNSEDKQFNNLDEFSKYVDTKFEKVLSSGAFNDFIKENKFILNRINKQFIENNGNILKINQTIDKYSIKNVNDIVENNKNLDFKLKKNIETVLLNINNNNSFNNKINLLYFIVKLILLYGVYHYIFINNGTCNM